MPLVCDRVRRLILSIQRVDSNSIYPGIESPIVTLALASPSQIDCKSSSNTNDTIQHLHKQRYALTVHTHTCSFSSSTGQTGFYHHQIGAALHRGACKPPDQLLQNFRLCRIPLRQWFFHNYDGRKMRGIPEIYPVALTEIFSFAVKVLCR